jgi:ABC-type nitrate/sulfonate/bicarbonate transport system permease component
MNIQFPMIATASSILAFGLLTVYGVTFAYIVTAILLITLIWNIGYAMNGGPRFVSREALHTARTLHSRKLSFIRHFALPAIFPHIMTGSILAIAESLNIITVFLLTGNNDTTFSVVTFILLALVNIIIWKKLVNYGSHHQI